MLVLSLVYFQIICLSLVTALSFSQNIQGNTDLSDAPEGDKHPYVGLPISTWKIIDLSFAEKEAICVQQKEFCKSECGGQKAIAKNFCNLDSMGWECSCQNHVPDVPPYGWPITIAECQGKEQACINNCSSGALQNICIKGCGLYYKCKKAGSLPSGLRVSDENKIPVYNTHASEGEGSSASLLACFSCSLYTSFFIGSVVSFISALL